MRRTMRAMACPRGREDVSRLVGSVLGMNYRLEGNIPEKNPFPASQVEDGNCGKKQGGPSGTIEAGRRFLVTGALGQIGLELVPHLRSRFGTESVVATDVKSPTAITMQDGPYAYCDVREMDSLAQVILDNRVTSIIHLASLLSASSERNPQLALDVNMKGVQNVLEIARQLRLRVFAPSTIAVFGPSSLKDMTPNTTMMDPTTIYGITKIHLELLGEYYRRTFGVDFRSLRYPGVISSRALPGGGTTDYAVDIFHAALKDGRYTCYLDRHQMLPMMYMPDCVKATIQLLQAPQERLSKSTYNVTAMSFTPEELAHSIQQYIPSFKIDYCPDFRQHIAETWPRTINDRVARKDWGWHPDFNLQTMVPHMLQELMLHQSQDDHHLEQAAAS